MIYNYNKLTPFKKYIIQNFPYIDADFDSLNNYGLYCKVVEYLNKVIDEMNGANEQVEILTNAFNVLHDYVEDYFDNLNVQDEINNKLDDMVISGEFQTILSNVAASLLTGKIDKDGVGQVTVQNLSQGVRELLTGGSTAVVGFDTVGNYNVQPGSIDYSDLSPNMQKNNACLPNYSRKYFLFENGRRDTSDDGSLVSSNTIVCSTTTFKTGHCKYAIKMNPGFVCYIIGFYNGNKVYVAGSTGFSDFGNDIFGIACNTSGYENVYEYYLEIRKSDQSNITPTDVIDAYEMYEYNEQTIDKIIYSSLDDTLQKFLYEDETSIHPYSDILVGTILSTSPFKFMGKPFTDDTNNRGFVTTPYYLPAGTTIVCTDDWQCVICTKASRNESTKDYYPSSFSSSITVQSSNTYYLVIRKSDNSNFWNIRNEFAENCTITFPSQRALSRETFYVSPDGNDTTGDGTSGNPYRQISKALNEGAKTISVAVGKYNPFSIIGDDVKICGEIENYNSSSNPKQEYATITNGEELTVSASSGLLVASYTADSDSSMYKCLIAKTKNINDDQSARSNGYYATIYSKGDKNTSHRYIPTLSNTEVLSTPGTFYYEDSTITIHPYSDNDATFEYYLVDSDMITTSNLCSINSANNVTIENMAFEFSDGNLLNIGNASNVEINNCRFIGSSLNNNVALNNANADIENCVSYLARNDGYNFHGFGSTSVINCIGCNCFDDGISHHDQCNSVISGGEYYGNNKGGVSTPTYGASSTIESVYSHNNGYGVYCVSDSDHENNTIYLSNCLLENNLVAANVSSAKGCIYNNVLHGNTTGITGTNDCVKYNNINA